MHYPTIAPSLRAGKRVFVEWPLAENIAKTRELLVLAQENGIDPSTCIIGLQSRVSPLALLVKEQLKSGTIGTVLSSHVTTFGHLLPRDSLLESLSYFADRETGGNPIVIENGHALNYIHHVLGEFESFRTRMQIQRPSLKIFNTEGETIRSVTTNVPDLFSVHGTLKPSDGKIKVASGATLAQTFRTGPPFKHQPTTTWSIAGTKGELLITIHGHFHHSHKLDPVTIQHHDHETDEVKEIDWNWAAYQKELPNRSRMIAELYERYAEWVGGGERDVKEGREWPGLGDAVVRMEEFNEAFRGWDGK